MAIAIVSLALIYKSNNDSFKDVRIALGAVATGNINAQEAAIIALTIR